MKEIPILFSTAMVQAILEGRKSQTRRLVQWPAVPQWHHPDYDPCTMVKPNGGEWWPHYRRFGFNGKRPVDETGAVKCPYGNPGDVLWVRETYMIEGSMSHGESVLGVKYKAGGRWIQNDSKEVFEIFHKSKEGWRPSIHLPKVAARIWLKVESVRVERLQGIIEADAIAEGIEQVGICPSDIQHEYKDYCGELKRIGETKEWGLSPIGSFQSLWVKINGAESWQANPWVWVVSFKVLSTTGKPAEKSAVTNK